MAVDKVTGEDQLQLQAVWFAAGTAALIACIERAVVVSLFAHWRVWAFLALNLLLLAILFTSKPHILPPNQTDDRENLRRSESTTRRRRRTAAAKSPPLVADKRDESVKTEAINAEDEDVDGKQSDGQDQISKEELNKRVEAFIAMFRQQYLVADAKGKSFGACFSHSNNVCITA